MNFKDILGGILSPISQAYQKRQERKTIEHSNKMKNLEAQGERQATLIREGLAADATWELEQIRNSGWKDEWVLILLSIPLIGCFIKPVQPYIQQGFSILQTTPDWYRWLVMLIFTAIYGIRIWRRQQYDTE